MDSICPMNFFRTSDTTDTTDTTIWKPGFNFFHTTNTTNTTDITIWKPGFSLLGLTANQHLGLLSLIAVSKVKKYIYITNDKSNVKGNF